MTPRGDRCDTLEEAEVAMRTRLHHQTVRYSILVRPVTNTVVAVRVSRNTKDARPLLRHVPPGSTVCMDPEYDVEYNYEYGFKHGITLIVRPKLRDGKPYGGRHRSQALREFSWRRYRRRKLAERPIGNRAARDGGTLNYRRPDTRRKGLTLKYIAHNLRALSTQLAWQEILRPAQVR